MSKPESDIVERLRDEAAKVAVERGGNRGVSSRDATGSVIWEAADLITALRAKVEEWAAQALKEDDCRQMWQGRAEAAETKVEELTRQRDELAAFGRYMRDELWNEPKSVWRDVRLSLTAKECIEMIEERVEVAEAELARIKAAMGEPVPFLCRHRFKLTFNKSGNCTSLGNFADVLDGQWVWLIEATDGMNDPVFAIPSENKGGEA
jgi:hypothetical protein